MPNNTRCGCAYQVCPSPMRVSMPSIRKVRPARIPAYTATAYLPATAYLCDNEKAALAGELTRNLQSREDGRIGQQSSAGLFRFFHTGRLLFVLSQASRFTEGKTKTRRASDLQKVLDRTWGSKAFLGLFSSVHRTVLFHRGEDSFLLCANHFAFPDISTQYLSLITYTLHHTLVCLSRQTPMSPVSRRWAIHQGDATSWSLIHIARQSVLIRFYRPAEALILLYGGTDTVWHCIKRTVPVPPSPSLGEFIGPVFPTRPILAVAGLAAAASSPDPPSRPPRTNHTSHTRCPFTLTTQDSSKLLLKADNPMNDTEHMPMFPYSPFYLSVYTRGARHVLLHHQQTSQASDRFLNTRGLLANAIAIATELYTPPPTSRFGGFLPPADLASRLTPLPERSRQNAPPATTQLPAGLSGPTPRHTDGQPINPESGSPPVTSSKVTSHPIVLVPIINKINGNFKPRLSMSSLNQAHWSTLSRQMHTQEVNASHGNTSDNNHYDLSEGVGEHVIPTRQLRGLDVAEPFRPTLAPRPPSKVAPFPQPTRSA
ncbi:uncharacterized protein CLUP02_18208 [Colletotrichum lupini]|uniref:Uncharacterized protein n=1 Tax=Colletotrichum lupini TaxID=145971 RepID=A0A9Q8SGJ5_9PEZI|nr:uncharacterized protein CLUP02_18208 [Colletotrichum lupini]UQC76693.1 hypothetical protein CLUP02_18208 [Colletotrichum lupini]